MLSYSDEAKNLIVAPPTCIRSGKFRKMYLDKRQAVNVMHIKREAPDEKLTRWV